MVDYQVGNGSKNYVTKKASQPRGKLVVFSKKSRKFKVDYQRGNGSNKFITKKAEEHEKYIQSLLGAFNQEL